MKTLRKLAAIFCALGMLVPSVAMATFGNTFGSPQTITFTGGVAGAVWPTPTTPPDLNSQCLSSHQNGEMTDTCVGESQSDGTSTRLVRKGWVIRDLNCLKQKGFSAAGDDFALEWGVLMIKSGSTLDVVRVDPTILITPATVNAKYGSTELLWMQFSQRINYSVPYDGHVGITAYQSVQGGASVRFEWTCTLTIQTGA